MLKFLREMIIIKRKIILISVILVVAFVFLQHFTKRTYQKTVYDLFDTVCTITVTDSKDNTDKYLELLRNADAEFDAFDDTSPLYKLNSGKKASFSKSGFAHLEKAINYSKEMPQFFDISINPVSVIWNDCIKKQELPQNIESLCELVGITCITTDPKTCTAEIDKSNASVTLGATAKGYATALLAEEMRSDGIKSGLINLGGSIYAIGKKADGKAWNIGIANPSLPSKSAVTLECSDIAVVTSGDYQRYFDLDGTRYHHIIDPVTLMPSANGLHSATAISNDAELCDIMSTALFVAGAENAKSLCEKYSVDAILISNDKIYCTEGAFALIKDVDKFYDICVF